MRKISVIIPVFNEEKTIEESITSLLSCDCDDFDIELIAVDGGSTDGTLKKLEELKEKFSNINVLHNPKRITPISLNLGIKAAKGQIIIRADAHSVYPENYIKELVYWLEKLGADNVGGVFVIEPNKSPISRAIASVLGSKFGVGNAHYRFLDAGEPFEVETVPYGCWRREVFDKIGYFDERLERNQDIEFNKRLRRSGGKIFLIPHLHIRYKPRDTLAGFVRYAIKNGRWNILTVFITKSFKSLSVRHFVPLFFTLSLIFLPLLGLIAKIFYWLLAVELVLYFALATVFAIKKSRKNKVNFLLIVLMFFIWHFFYGLGELLGFLSFRER